MKQVANIKSPAPADPARVSNSLVPIHYIMSRCGPGGAELSVRNYVDAFSTQRQLHAYSLRPAANQIIDGAKISYRHGNKEGWGYVWDYFRYCRAHRNDIFHLLSTGPVVLLVTLLSGIRKPIYHIHGTIYWKKAIQKFYLKPAWRLCALFEVVYIANSAYSAAVFQREALPVAPMVIYNGLPIRALTAHRHCRTQIQRMAYVGRLSKGKNPELVIPLFEAIATDFPQLQLLLAGEGNLRPQLESMIAASPFRDRIQLLGFIEDIAGFYGSIDLAVFLSSYESFGNVLPEALSSGLPVLTSDLPVFAEIFGEERTFILGNPQNFPEIKDNFLKAVARFPQLAKKAFELSREVEARFGIEAHLAQMQRVYAQH